MSEVNTKQVKTKKKRKKLSRSALVLIIGLLIIAIPVIIFLAILGISALQTGTPREGSRFDNDLDPAITSEQVSSLKSSIESLGSFDDVEVVLSQGQLKVFIDTRDNLSAEEVDKVVTDAYNTVNSALPINTYFKATDAKKMYDLQINVYTTATASPIGSESTRQYKLLHKNSTEASFAIDDLAHPKDPNLAAELEGLVESPEEPSEEAAETETETTE